MKKPSSPSRSAAPKPKSAPKVRAGKVVKAPKPTKTPGASRKALNSEVRHQNIVAKVATKRARAATSRVSRLDDYRKAGRFKRYAIGSLLVSLVLLIALVLAAVYSPLLSVQKIVITGNQRVSHQKLVNALDGQIGRPLPQVANADIAGLLKQFTLIESFSLISQPPHT